ncbi:transcriptional regulator GlxA family with amidase domain [Kitasatospora sp. MAA4]|nr:transcriptional regulator GlxA family with amidase domain [Kitasatospora sp. MAA4]
MNRVSRSETGPDGGHSPAGRTGHVPRSTAPLAPQALPVRPQLAAATGYGTGPGVGPASGGTGRTLHQESPAPGQQGQATGASGSGGGVGTLTGTGAATGTATLTGNAPRKLSGRRRRETVAVLIFSGAPIFESSIPLSVFGVDRQDAGVPRYRLLVCAGEDGPLTTTGGMTLTAPFGLEALARAGTIVVPAWRSISQPPPVEAIAALRKAHHEGARIIGLCTGAFVLAAAGLLDGRPATTHWMYAPTLAKRYPRVHVDPRELFVDDGDVLTSAGTAAGIDLCLHVVRSDHGAEAANALARRLVVPNRRSGGGQAQYIDQSLPEEIGNDPLAEVVTWALENLNQQFDVEVLAARAYMSRRTFDRRFRTLTGSAPLQWLITQRVLQAQRLLETSELSVDDVARRCGFRSPVALRGHFRRQLGVSPAAYRTTYRARRPGPLPGSGVPAQGASADRPLGAPAGSAVPPFTGAAAGATGPGGTAGGSGAASGAATSGYPAQSGSAAQGQGQGHSQAQGRPAPAQPALPSPAKNRIRPLVPPQPGPATRRGPARPVEHAVAEDGHSQPSARGKGSGHRADRPSPESASGLGRPGSPDGRLGPGAGVPPRQPLGRQPAVQPAVQPGASAAPRQSDPGQGPGTGPARAARPAASEQQVAAAGEQSSVDAASGGRVPEEDRSSAHPNAPREAPDGLPLPASRDRAVG